VAITICRCLLCERLRNGPQSAPVPDFDSQEKLRQEKELLGFYISDHPLKSVQRPARVLAPINLAELHEQPDKVTLSADRDSGQR
jgi:DNA polymerase-3 subunit alpha